MKHYFLSCVTLSIAIAFTQCSTNTEKSNKIALEPALNSNEEVLLSNYASAIDYVALDTQEGVMLPDKNSISLRAANNELFLCNVPLAPYDQACHRYTNDGKYLNSIGIKGRAPGEFVAIFNIEVDAKEKTVKVYDVNKLVAYDFSGKLAYETNKDSLSKEEAVKCSMGRKSGEFIYNNYHEHSIIPEKNDTITNLDGTTRYVLDYGTYKSEDKENPKVKLLVNKYIETSSFLKLDILFTPKEYPNLSQRNRFCEVVFDKKTGKAKSLKSDEGFPLDGFINDIDGGAPFWPVYAIDNKMYQILDAIDFIAMAKKSSSERMKSVASKLTEESNPVIVIVTLK